MTIILNCKECKEEIRKQTIGEIVIALALGMTEEESKKAQKIIGELKS